MKRLLTAILCLWLLVSFCSCSDNSDTETGNSSVTINFDNNDTVNGYRSEVSLVSDNNESSLASHNTSSKTNHIASTVITPNDSVSNSYCGNINTKIFHKSNCGSVKTMKDSNKHFASDRNSFINEGYAPCKRCNP